MINSSQEVVWGSPVDVSKFILFWCWVELQESVLHELVNLHYSGFVTASVTVVWCWEHCDDVSIVWPVVSIHYKLMCSGNQFKVVRMVELFRDILPERVSGTSWRDTPSASVIWVGPEKITDWTLVWHLHDSIELLDLIKGVDTWGETTMETEDISFNDCGQWKVIEQWGEVLPDVGVTILSKALIIESIDLGDLLTLVVTSEDGDSAWVSDLAADEEGNSLNWVVSTIDIITHEEIVVVWQFSTDLKELFQIVELTMDITADGDWSSDWLNIAFSDKDLLGLLAKSLDAILWEWLAVQKLLDRCIEWLDVWKVYFCHISNS